MCKKLTPYGAFQEVNQLWGGIDLSLPVNPILKSRTRDSGLFGKIPLTEYGITGFKIDNLLGNIVSCPPNFVICIFGTFRVCNGHARFVGPFLRIVFVWRNIYSQTGLILSTYFLLNFDFFSFLKRPYGRSYDQPQNYQVLFLLL